MSISTSIAVGSALKPIATVFKSSSSRISEMELVKGCKKGKRKAQNQLYSQYCDAMLAIAMRYCSSQAEAEDALQDAFLKIFKNIKSFEGRHEGSLTQWIKTIVVNSALSLHRKNKKHQYSEDVTELPIADDSDLVMDLFDDNESSIKHNKVLQEVQKMPAGYRAVFNLYVVEGYSHKEISEILEVSESTSKSQLSKARKYLKTVFGVKEQRKEIKKVNE